MPSFGPLIGVVHLNNTHCRFLIYSTKNAEVLTFHEQELRQIVHRPGWMEFDPDEIWKLTKECIEVAYKNLIILDIHPGDIVAVSICNQRGTTLLWDKETGNPLYNCISWADARTVPILQTLLKNVKYDVNYLRTRSGLPLSSCFMAPKVKWLIENVPAVSEAITKNSCMCGTMDSWILWNLTGGKASGIHATDITNACYTQLMNVKTLQWDVKLCQFFRIPMSILPKIRTNSEVYGFVIGGSLNGLPIAGCIGDQPASLLGQLAEVGQNVCSMDDSCFVLLNTGQELIESDNGLLSSIAYKLGTDSPTSFMLEGAIANAGSSITWLQNRLNVNTELLNPNDNAAEVLNTFFSENSMLSSSCSSNLLNADGNLAIRRSEITFVPAFHGLYSPYWRYDARGMIFGLTSHTTAQHVTQAAYEATGFQVYEIIEALKRDTRLLGSSYIKDNLVVGGEFAENGTFVQFVADIVGCRLIRPQTTSPIGLGAMIAAGITLNVVSLTQAKLMYMPPSDVFTPKTAPNRRELLYKRWSYAVRKCLAWNNYESYESDLALFAQRECDLNYPIRRSIPGSIFVTSAFVLLLVARFLQSQNIS